MEEKLSQLIDAMKSVSGELGDIKSLLSKIDLKLETFAINKSDVLKEVVEINLKIDKIM